MAIAIQTFISTKKTSNNNEGKKPPFTLANKTFTNNINNTNHNLKENKCK